MVIRRGKSIFSQVNRLVSEGSGHTNKGRFKIFSICGFQAISSLIICYTHKIYYNNNLHHTSNLGK